jgi:hypothetical protein
MGMGAHCGGGHGKGFVFNDVWGCLAVGDLAADAAQFIFGALGLAVELAGACLDGKEVTGAVAGEF